jgi:mannose-6-phosphate isomerase-like protein (cupin superfamily)
LLRKHSATVDADGQSPSKSLGCARIFAKVSTVQEDSLTMSDTKPANTPEIDHEAAEAAIQKFRFKAPETYSGRKAIVKMCGNERHALAVHVLGDGGENNLHYHSNVDITWMVLKGRARFYGPGDEIRGEFGPHEGLLIPGGARYWFESCGEEGLEMLQIKTFVKGRGNDRRIDAESRDRVKGHSSQFDAAVTG